jgi:WD40 repeat protein
MGEELHDLVFDFRWLESKLSATDVNALMADYDHLQAIDEARLIQGALRLAAHVLSRDGSQLASQLWGRLSSDAGDLVARALAGAAAAGRQPRLRPLRPTLSLSGGHLLRILEGHTRPVMAVARLDERRVVSASGDRTLRVWDVERGATLAMLEGQTDWVRAVARLDERRVVSASGDRTLRVWDVERGATVAVAYLDGPTTAVAVMPNRKTVVAGDSRGGIHYLVFEEPDA